MCVRVAEMERLLKFGWRHFRDALEYARKILRIVKGKAIGDLREIQLAFADQLLGPLNFDLQGVACNGFSRLLLEHAAQIAFAVSDHRANVADPKRRFRALMDHLLDGRYQMAFHGLLGGEHANLALLCHVADQKDQQLLEIGFDQLLSANRRVLPLGQLFQKRIVFGNDVGSLGLADDGGEKGFEGFV